jgi:hypothetical protein
MELKGWLVMFFFHLSVASFGQQPNAMDSLTAVGGEVESMVEEVQEKKDSLINLPTALQDSLQITQQLDSLRNISQALDTLGIKKALDSLQQLPQQAAHAQAKIDSLQGLLDISSRANTEIASLEQQLNLPFTGGRQQLQEQINQATRLDGVSREGLADLKEQTGININTQLPEVEGVGLDGIKLPGMEKPALDIPGMEMFGIDTPKLNTSLPGLELEGLDDMQGKLGELSQLSKEAEAYTEDALKLSEGKLREVENADKLAEQQFLKSEAGQAFQQELGGSQQGMEGMQQLAGRDFAKGQATEKVYEAATDHFAGHTEELKAAQTELNKYKGRFQKVESVKDMPKNWWKLNPLKELPWQERILFGSLWQFGKQEQFLIDVGPTLVWRFTDKIEAGGGYQWRLNIDNEKPWLNSRDKVYGYHFFVDYKFKKGFFARLIFEELNTQVPRFNNKREVESTEQEWVKGLSVGLGKRYTFYKSMQGYSMVQYNVLHRHHKTPYTQPFQAKIGFYINGKHLLKWKKEKE